MQDFKVKSNSDPKLIAGAMARYLRVDEKINLQGIGPAAVNQAVKAVAIAQGYLITEGIKICCIPYFEDVEVEGQNRTSLHLLVERML